MYSGSNRVMAKSRAETYTGRMPRTTATPRPRRAATRIGLITVFGAAFFASTVLLVVQANWVAAVSCAVVAATAWWVTWQLRRPVAGPAVSAPPARQPERRFTALEDVGYAGMAGLYAAALAATALTGDWMWAVAAALSGVCGLLVFLSRARRGQAPSLHAAVDTLF